jgi:hypothetical protein
MASTYERECPCQNESCHQLYRVNSYEPLDLNDFKNLVTKEEYLICEKRPKTNAWYPLTVDIFIRFLN